MKYLKMQPDPTNSSRDPETHLRARNDGPLRTALICVTSLTPSFIFALAGFAKILDPTKALVFMKAGLGIYPSVSRSLIIILAMLELIVSVFLAFFMGRSTRPAFMALMLIGVLMGLIIAVAHAHPVGTWTCGCFGELQPLWGGNSLMAHARLNAFLALILLVNIRLIERFRRPG